LLEEQEEEEELEELKLEEEELKEDEELDEQELQELEQELEKLRLEEELDELLELDCRSARPANVISPVYSAIIQIKLICYYFRIKFLRTRPFFIINIMKNFLLSRKFF